MFTDHWSIPYKREESLGKCLVASTSLARLGKTTLMRLCLNVSEVEIDLIAFSFFLQVWLMQMKTARGS